MPAPSAVRIDLSEHERAQLQAWADGDRTAQALAQRSRIVLLAAAGLKNTEIAERLGVHRSSVTRWRSRFSERRLAGLLDEPRPGKPRTITDEQIEVVVARTLQGTPPGAAQWTTRSLAKELGLTQSAVHRIWKAFGLRPQRRQARTSSEAQPLLQPN
jgi:transposase